MFIFTGFYPGYFWKICWLILTPLLCILVTVFSLIKYERFKYKDYVYPLWGEIIGILMALSSIIVIPIYAIYKIIEGKYKNVKYLIINLYIR